MRISLYFGICLLAFVGLCSPSASGQSIPHKVVEQSPEAVEAYRVCERFEQLLGENLDFKRAYEATFTKNVARRRAIAIADGEFGNFDFASVDDATLVNAYQNQMQTFYLMFPLAGPDSDAEAELFFPPEVKQLFHRQTPRSVLEFRQLAARLERGVPVLRAHLETLAAKYPAVAARVRRFKSEALAAKFALPTDYKVEPQRGTYKSSVLGSDEAFYGVEGYTVIREDGQMKIVGINFFNRLF